MNAQPRPHDLRATYAPAHGVIRALNLDRLPYTQLLKLSEDAADDLKHYVEHNMREVFQAINAVIAASPRESTVNSLTDPAFFKMRKEPIESVHQALLKNWDAIKGGKKAFFVFIASLKSGIKTIKRSSTDHTTPSSNAGESAAKRKRSSVKKLAVHEVEEIIDKMVSRSTSTIARLCGTIDHLKREVEELRTELAESRVESVNA